MKSNAPGFQIPAVLLTVTISLSSVVLGDWKEESNRIIEQIRKRDLKIVVVDREGDPVSGATATIGQIRNGFPFGTAISFRLLRDPQYQEFVRSHFNWATFENETKWYSNERRQGEEDYRAADALMEWCDENGIQVHGHCIFWEPEKWQMEWLKALNPQDLRRAVERRLESAVTHFRGRFRHWDVNNEMLHGSFYKDRLGEEIWPWMFKRAHELDPEAMLFVNEFNVLSVDQNFSEVETDKYVEHTRWLIDQGAPVHGVGIQGHIWYDDILSRPEVIRERLDRVGSLGLPVWITEFDSADEDEMVNADRLELVYRTAFGHPAVEGIVMWAAWAGDSWRGPNAGLAHLDWSLNESGRRYEALMEEWSTRDSGTTDAEGIYRFRAFLGQYQVTVSVDDRKTFESFELSKGEGPQEVRIQLN
jgi:endo-1,4-beta-xylanase